MEADWAGTPNAHIGHHSTLSNSASGSLIVILGSIQFVDDCGVLHMVIQLRILLIFGPKQMLEMMDPFIRGTSLPQVTTLRYVLVFAYLLLQFDPLSYSTTYCSDCLDTGVQYIRSCWSMLTLDCSLLTGLESLIILVCNYLSSSLLKHAQVLFPMFVVRK